MIDLSTLIAMLTALASATASAPSDSSGASVAANPPAQHCRATPGPSDRTGSGVNTRSPESPPTITLTVPPPIPAEPSESNRYEFPKPTPQRMRADRADDDDDEADTDKSSSDRKDDDSDSTSRRSSERSTSSAEPRSTEAEKPDSSDGDSDAKDSARPSDRDTSGRSADSDSSGGKSGDDRSEGDSGCARPAPSTRSKPPATRTNGAAEAPSDVVDLQKWYLTLPTGAPGDPDTVQPAQLAGYTSDFFRLNERRDGVVFTAPVDGATTRNSDYPRSELREMSGSEEASWSNGNGTHTLRATEAVTELPESKPEIVTAQIHGGDDDIMQIRLENNQLMVQYADGAKQVMLDPNYQLGAPYDIEIVAAADTVRVSYNGEQKADLPLSGNTWYFKAGAYVQSNPSKGDATNAVGQVIVYALEVSHR